MLFYIWLRLFYCYRYLTTSQVSYKIIDKLLSFVRLNLNFLVHGNWNVWVEGECSTKCGNGTKTRSRACNNPAPAHGGLHCSNANGLNQTLSETITLTCTNECCPGMSFLNCFWFNINNNCYEIFPCFLVTTTTFLLFQWSAAWLKRGGLFNLRFSLQIKMFWLSVSVFSRNQIDRITK